MFYKQVGKIREKIISTLSQVTHTPTRRHHRITSHHQYLQGLICDDEEAKTLKESRVMMVQDIVTLAFSEVDLQLLEEDAVKLLSV